MFQVPRTTMRTHGLYLFVGMLVIAIACVWHEVFARGGQGDELAVLFLNVGQGDAILIEAPNGNRVLIDGGKDLSVLREMGKRMTWSERTVDVVVATHPDLDHIGGLPEVFARYEVSMFVEPCVHDDGADYVALQEAVLKEGLVPVCARAGMELTLDTGITLSILFPDRDVSGMDPNTGGIVARLMYGDTSFLFTGDAPISIEEYLSGVYGETLRSNVLKVGHHGSKTSTSDMFLGTVAPEYAIVSAGCDNSYGHPHKEVVERLARFEVHTLDTCNNGTMRIESDGHTVTRVQ